MAKAVHHGELGSKDRSGHFLVCSGSSIDDVWMPEPQDVAVLQQLGDAESNWAVYSATPEGVERALALSDELPGQAVEYLRSAVGWTRKLTFSQLVSAIYARYPEQRANSVFVD